MKQITLKIAVEEHLDHLELMASPIRGAVNEFHHKAWRILTGRENAMVGVNEPVEPKDGWSIQWEYECYARFARVFRDRKVKTIVTGYPCGNPKIKESSWKVTVFFDKLKQKPLSYDRPGYWEMFSVSKGGQKRKVCRINESFDCCGDDLYCELPEPAENYDIEPDYGDIFAMSKTGGTNYQFRFHATKKQKVTT